MTEYLISYNGAPWMFTVSIMEFRGDRVARERIYIMDGFEPAEWRAPWRAERRARTRYRRHPEARCHAPAHRSQIRAVPVSGTVLAEDANAER